MFIRRSFFSMLGVLLFVSPALSDVIPVPDYDFSNPTAPAVFGGATPSDSASSTLGSWQVSPPPEGYPPGLWYEGAGVFYNDPSDEYVNNAPGSQTGYMFTNSGLTLTQTLSTNYQIGKSYQLTVGAGGGSGEFGPMALGTTMQIGLYYMSGGSQVMIGTPTNIVNDDSDLSGPGGYVDTLSDFTFNMPAVGAGDPWAGQPIGVALIQPLSAPNDGSYWDVDNVRLVSVPEPGSMALLSTGLLMLLLGRRRLSAKQILRRL
jgi:hapalindole biogenesis HpiC1 cyclase-like protein/PEP-CTERM motif-containing protein